MVIAWDEKRVPWFWPALAAVMLGAYFAAVYNVTNILAEGAAVRVAPHFKWEMKIPLVPWTIVPYWSIDLFFLAGPFLCRTRRELAAVTMRLAVAITVGGICFLVWPLTLAWGRVTNAGIFQGLFDVLYGFDKPHNLAPSLHIAIIAMLWPIYARHTLGVVRWALHGWFTLIFVSVFTTHQHHVIDVATACALAVWCWYVFPDHLRPTARIAPCWPIAWRYFGGGVACVLLAAVLGVRYARLAWIPLWPAFALGAVGVGYAGAGGWVFRKNGGRLPWSTKIVLLPFLAGTWGFHVWFRRGVMPWNCINQKVLLGRWLSNRRAKEAMASGVVAVLDMTSEYSECRVFREQAAYLNVPVLDYSVPSLEDLERAVVFVMEQSKRGVVYVHCAMGFSRSAAIVASVLVRSTCAATAAEAVEMIRKERPRIHIWPALAAGIARHAEK